MSRSERFRERVKLEREILRTVNSNSMNVNLRGLSLDSIESWRQAAASVLMPSKVDKIAECLVNISVKLKISAAASRIAFEPQESRISIEDEYANLMMQLGHFHVNS